MNRSGGKSEGYAGLWGFIVAGIATAAVVFGVVWTVTHAGK
jgi:hypothetical protein